MKKALLSLVLLAVAGLPSASAASDYTPKYQLINNPEYPTNDLAVATYNLMDYGVDNTGHTDCTATINALLRRLNGIGDKGSLGEWKNVSGGILYIPEGRYLIKGRIEIPRGVTIRGDWKKPDGKSPIKGTILVIKPDAKVAGTTTETDCAVIMQPSTEVSNLTFWYPDQDANNVTPYPPTIVYGYPRYWGNDYCNVRHVTFVNSYTGVFFSQTVGGGCPNVFDVYGTPLCQGIVMDNIADVGRFDWISFSPNYWANSGLEGSPSEAEARACVKANGTGIVMRRNDWSYTCNFTCDGYKVGFHADESKASYGGRPNGHNYGFNLNDCATGILLSSTSSSGIMFTRVNITNCGIGIHSEGGQGPVQFLGCAVQANTSVYTDISGGVGMLLQQCSLHGKAEISGGQFTSVNCTYDGDVTVYPMARSIFTGNSVKNGRYTNKSIYLCKYNETPVPDKPLPEYKPEWMEIKETRPARAALYVVTDAEFGAKPVDILTDLATQPDNSVAIQRALDKAGREGGGIVYLPPGHYRMDHGITIPTGVELKGSGDIATVPKGNGSILEVYGVNEGNENADAFVTMGEGSGLRGVHFNYPKQTLVTDVKKYPYTIRGNKDCYVVNVAARTAYRVLDLFTNKCDNHYVDYLAGHAYMNVVRVGGGSENGVISNIQCNTNAYAYGDETKFGSWPNSESCKDNDISALVYDQNYKELDFLIVGDCKDEVLYNNFLFGCHDGMRFQKDNGRGATNVHALGNAVDGAVNTVVVNGIETDLNLTNSQIVALNRTTLGQIITSPLEAHFITTGKDFDKSVNLFSSNLWGSGNYMTTAQGGTVNFYLTNMAASGAKYTFNAPRKAKINVVGGYIQAVKDITADATTASNTSIYSTVFDQTGREGTWAKNKCNLTMNWAMDDMSGMLPRTGWVATAEKNNANANNVIDNDSGSRWATNCGQKDAVGSWLNINMNADCTFNTVILNSVNSFNDGPAAYKVEVYYDGTWHEEATGSNGGAITVIVFDKAVTASQVRISLLDNTKGNYWSVHELYLANLDVTTGVKAISASDAMTAPDTMVEVYTLGGMKVAAFKAGDSLPSMGKGIYIVRYVSGGKTVRTTKLVVK